MAWDKGQMIKKKRVNVTAMIISRIFISLS